MTITKYYQQVAAIAITTPNTLTSVYIVPSQTTFVGQIIVVNTHPTDVKKFSLAIVGAGGTPAAKHYLNYNLPLVPGETWCTNQITIQATDQVWISGDATSSVTPGTGIVLQMYGEVQVTS